MRFIGRWIWIAIALALASAAAIVFLPLAVFFDPKLRQLVQSLQPEELRALFLLFLDPERIANMALSFFAFLWLAVLAVGVVPVTLIAVIGEAAGLRSLAWYAGLSGIVAGAMPWIVRGARGTAGPEDSLTHMLEMRFALIFFLTGVVAGLIYWFAAGRNAGRAASG